VQKNILYEPTYGIYQDHPLSLEEATTSSATAHYVGLTLVISLIVIGIAIIYYRTIRERYQLPTFSTIWLIIQRYRGLPEEQQPLSDDLNKDAIKNKNSDDSNKEEDVTKNNTIENTV